MSALAGVDSRAAQDVLLRLLADGPFRTAALAGVSGEGLAPEVAAILGRVDVAGLDRFGRFLCRHYYRERVVHYFKYARALAPRTGRAPEAVLKTCEFADLMPRLILGESASARLVLDSLRRHLADDAGSVGAIIPYWNDLVAYQGASFLCDALPPERGARPFAARAETAEILEFGWDLPAVLPLLLQPFRELPVPPRQPTRLLFARSARGEVTVLRCTEALQRLLDGLTGDQSPDQVATRLGLDPASFEIAWSQLERMGAIDVSN